MRAHSLLVFFALPVAACSPYSPDLGTEPFLCGSAAPVCPDGYACTSTGSAGVCTKLGGSGGGVDSGNGSGNCNVDPGNLEPNESITNAWQTPVDGGGTHDSFPLAMLSICPAGDKDTYAMQISLTGENIELLIDYGVEGATLQSAILNSSGIAVAMGMPVTGSANHVRAYLANAAAGEYYAQVFGPVSEPSTNTYNLTINVTGP